MKRFSFVRSFVLSLLFVACGGSSGDDLVGTPTTGAACTPGQQISCSCLSGAGVQRCKDDGKSFDACQCGGGGAGGGAGGQTTGGQSAGGASAGQTSGGQGGQTTGGQTSGGQAGQTTGGQTSAGAGGAMGGAAGSAGGPTSFTCAAAEAEGSNVGCDFWPTVTPNLVWSIFDFAVGVSNPGDLPADVVVERAGKQVATVKLAPGASDVLYLPWVKELKGSDSDNCGTVVADTMSLLVPGGAFHLTSSAPIAAFQFSAWEYQGKGGPPGKSWAACPGNETCSSTLAQTGCFSFSNDASMLLPTSLLGTSYTSLGTTGWEAGGVRTSWTLTATEDGTTVTASLGKGASVAAGPGVSATPVGGTFSGTLSRGDVLLVRGGTAAADLSGSTITVSKPVQFLSATSCIQVPLGTQACDHVEDTILPTALWGDEYDVPVPTGPGGKIVGHVVRFVGLEAATLSYDGSPGMTPPTSLSPGQVVELTATAAFRVKGTKPFAVVSLLQGGSTFGGAVGEERGDPAMTFPVPANRASTRLAFVVPSEHEEVWLDVVSKLGAPVVFDGAPVVAGTPLPGGMRQLHRLKVPLPSLGHTLSSPSGLTAQVLAYGKYTGVAYPAGLGKQAP